MNAERSVVQVYTYTDNVFLVLFVLVADISLLILSLTL